MPVPILPRLALLLLLACPLPFGAALAAEARFDVLLGDRVIGTLRQSDTGAVQSIESVLGNTPLGVADGAFRATSRPEPKAGAGARLYVGRGTSARKTREITVLTRGGQALRTLVDPPRERTALSDAAAVPAGVLDPAAGLARLVGGGAAGCPAPLRLYDGRRVVAISPAGEARSGTRLTCRMGYRVIAGPGHLSPLGIGSARMELDYDLGRPEGRRMMSLAMRSGLLHLRIRRRD